jgi:AbrB family looped-hinge helix DNA binding protein
MQTAQISTKGQIVIPKAIRDRHAFVDGQTVEVVDTPAGVLLRLPPRAKSASAEEIMARIRARNTYHGPAVTTEEMREAISDLYRDGGTGSDW